MNEKMFIKEFEKYLKKNDLKELLIDGKKYTSLVSEKTIKKLYNLLYKNLAEVFNEDIIKEKLIIAKEAYTMVELVVSRNKKYQFIPIDDETEKVLYIENFNSINNIFHFNNNKNEFFTIDEMLDIFKNQYALLKEQLYLDIKEESFEKKIYFKAQEHFLLATLIRDGFRQGTKQDLIINLMTANRYIKEISHNIKDKEFLGEIYILHFRIKEFLDVLMYKNPDYSLLKKATERAHKNQNVIMAALQYLVIELEDLEINRDTRFIIDYLYKNINNIEVKNESVINCHLHQVIDRKILRTFKIKKYKKEYTDKIIYIYETILKKMKEENHKKIKDVDKLAYELKATIKN